MIRPMYILFAVLTLVIFLIILGLFVFAVEGENAGPFDNGASPSLVTPEKE
jgi:hypothetical protein